MPSGPLEPAPALITIALGLEPRRILDLGMGTGKYGFLLREQADLAHGRIDPPDWDLELVGVEGYEAYVGAVQRAVYDEIVVADLREYVERYGGPPFDLALMLDVVEHFTLLDAPSVMRNVLGIAGRLLVATPTAYYRQEGPENELERHRSWWPRAALRRFARDAGLSISTAQLGHTNIALLSRHDVSPLRLSRPLRSSAIYLKNALIPELAYRKLRRETGPSILSR